MQSFQAVNEGTYGRLQQALDRYRDLTQRRSPLSVSPSSGPLMGIANPKVPSCAHCASQCANLLCVEAYSYHAEAIIGLPSTCHASMSLSWEGACHL